MDRARRLRHAWRKDWVVSVKVPSLSGPVPPSGWIVTLVPRPWLPALGFLMAVAIALGGHQHFQTPTFTLLRTVMPWWGWSLLFTGIAAAQAVPMRPCHEWKVRFIAAVPYLMFSVGMIPSVLATPTGATTGIAVYAWVAAVHLRIAANRRVDAKRRKAADDIRAATPEA